MDSEYIDCELKNILQSNMPRRNVNFRGKIWVTTYRSGAQMKVRRGHRVVAEWVPVKSNDLSAIQLIEGVHIAGRAYHPSSTRGWLRDPVPVARREVKATVAVEEDSLAPVAVDLMRMLTWIVSARGNGSICDAVDCISEGVDEILDGLSGVAAGHRGPCR
jgi:hypothetical protein